MSFENGNGGNMYMVPMAPNSYGNNGGFGGLNGDALWWAIVWPPQFY